MVARFKWMAFSTVLDVCLCAHNPRPHILDRVLQSIADQAVSTASFGFLLVDNGSTPALEDSLLSRFRNKGIVARMVSEPMLGIAHARLRAIFETNGDMLLFVDDDNELTPQYVSEGLRFASAHSDVGCFGGKLLLPPDTCPAAWVQPFLPYLAIKDIGDQPVFGMSSAWASWEPPTAGAFIRREVLDVFRNRAQNDESIFKLGRIGTKNLSSCEDGLIMSGAASLGLKNAYNPALILYHHLDERRFGLPYLIRLMYAYGVSNVVLDSLLNRSKLVTDGDSSWRQLLRSLRVSYAAARQSLPFGVGMLAYHMGAYTERRRQLNSKQ